MKISSIQTLIQTNCLVVKTCLKEVPRMFYVSWAKFEGVMEEFNFAPRRNTFYSMKHGTREATATVVRRCTFCFLEVFFFCFVTLHCFSSKFQNSNLINQPSSLPALWFYKLCFDPQWPCHTGTWWTVDPGLIQTHSGLACSRATRCFRKGQRLRAPRLLTPTPLMVPQM